MRTGPRDVLLLALARPTVNIDTEHDIVAGRQSQKRLAPPIVLRVTKQGRRQSRRNWH